MRWIGITSISDYQHALQESFREPVAIFKHSTRCSTSLLVKNRLERDYDIIKPNTPFYFLDIIQHRDISNQIAADLQIRHESPQLILIKDGKGIYNASHISISAKEASEVLEN